MATVKKLSTLLLATLGMIAALVTLAALTLMSNSAFASEGLTAGDAVSKTETTSTVVAGKGGPAPTDNGIPTLSLTIDPNEFQNVISSFDHSYRAEGGSIRISIPNGYEGEFGSIDAETIDQELDLKYIRGRGNSTWLSPKKPFKFKLDKTKDLLGMGGGQHWVLLANSYDFSKLRNRLTYYLGRRLGLEFTPKMVPVDFYVNGEYMGSYTLCQQIRIDKGSVDIDELGPEDQSESTISGGYLVALEPYSDEAEINKFQPNARTAIRTGGSRLPGATG